MKHLPRWLLLWGLILTAFGGKLWLIRTAGSDLPVLDQWNGEGVAVLQPWVEGHLSFADLATPHNEHRLILYRGYALGLFLLAGQWSGTVETVVNAGLHVLVAVTLLLGASRWLSGGWLAACGALLGVMLCAPFAWENTLVGFQAQFYFLLLFSVAHLFLTLESDRFSRRWLFGQCCGVLALISMASGFLSGLAVIGALVLRLFRQRRWNAQQVASFCFALLIVAVGWWMKTEVPGHAPLKARNAANFLQGFWQLLTWPAPVVLPIVVLPALAYLARNVRGILSLDPILLALISWVFLQCAAIAYGRGGGLVLASRYLDLLVVNVVLGFVFLILGLSGRVRLAVATLWLSAVIALVAAYGLKEWHSGVAPLIGFHRQQQLLVNRYVRTGDPALLAHKTWPEIPFPDARLLMQWLDTPAIRSVLPPSVREPVPLLPAVAIKDQSLPPDLPPPPDKLAFSTRTDGGGRLISSWRSDPVSKPTLPILRFRITGDLGSPSSELRLSVCSASGKVDVTSDAPPGARWKSAAVLRPSGPWWIEVNDRHPEAWFAFTEPVELSRFSWVAEKLVKWYALILGAGVVLLAAGGLTALGQARFARPLTDPREGSRDGPMLDPTVPARPVR